jgi:hypothetical protein
MIFEIDPTGDALVGELYYRASDCAFDFAASQTADLAHRMGSNGTTSIALGTLQLELGLATGTVLFAWGYSPRETWASGTLPPPKLRPGVVRVHSTVTLKPGVAVNFAETQGWTFTYDHASGWIFFGCAGTDSFATEIATGIGLLVQNGALRGVWLHPVSLE